MKDSKPANSETGGLIAAFFLLLISCMLGLSPFLFSLDMMQWGYGLLCIGGFISIAGLITLIMYIYRFLRFRAIVNGEHNLAYWHYSRELVVKKAEEELKNAKSENTIKLIMVWFFFILFTGIFLFIGISEDETESMLPFVGIMLAIAILISIVAVVAPYLIYQSSKNSAAEAIIATNGFFYLGQLHTWNKPFAFIDSVKIDAKNENLVFTIKYFTKLGWYKYESYTVNIPIPEGEIETAKKVVAKIK